MVSLPSSESWYVFAFFSNQESVSEGDTVDFLNMDQIEIFIACFTGQRVEIDVAYQPVERAAASGTIINKTLWASVVGCFVLLVLTAAIFICYLDRPGRSQTSTAPAPAPATPTVPAPMTPVRGSPAVLNEQSPRTPQPFVDYVRRTIDETPYYRQEGRRRFNLQNTM